MTDEQAAQTSQSEPQQRETPPPAPDVEAGKTFAILSYALSFIGLPFFLVPLITRNNEFSLYHAKQCLILWLGGIAAGVLSMILAVTVVLACVSAILMPVACIFLLVLNIMGLINAVKGEQKPLPLIGKWAEDWFKGLKKI